MLKYINLKEVLNENRNAFAFYNTETEHFLSFFNREIWFSKEDFIQCLENEKDKDSTLEIDQYLKIIPD
ncbi:MAG: hypothetical protein H7Y00_07350 [Fimbriimonadaceae bacterium]|nr:hypothetical protein [Chitinophagales bacterium]